MTGLSLIFYLFCLWTGLPILGVEGVNIQLYKHANFTGLIWESNSTERCNNVAEDNWINAESIRTDTCFIGFRSGNCMSYQSEKYMPGDIILSKNQLARSDQILSFHICNEGEGGHQLNLDITKFYMISSVSPDVLESYKNVCSCINVPHIIQDMSRWSINNHHNDFLAYYEPDCSENKWKHEFIPAGFNGLTAMHENWVRDIETHTTHTIESIGPNPNSTYFQNSCISSQNQTTDETKLTQCNCQDDIRKLQTQLTQLTQQFHAFSPRN